MEWLLFPPFQVAASLDKQLKDTENTSQVQWTLPFLNS